MTETKTIDIDTLPAGREMDALVAEKVMGLERVGYLYKYREYTESPRNVNMSEKDIPSYSTSIAPAWEVVERLHDLEWVVEVTIDNGVGRYCKIWKMGNKGREIIYEELDADTAPLAICRAALKAKS